MRSSCLSTGDALVMMRFFFFDAFGFFAIDLSPHFPLGMRGERTRLQCLHYRPLLSNSSFKARKLLLLFRRLVLYVFHSASRPCFWYSSLIRIKYPVACW